MGAGGSVEPESPVSPGPESRTGLSGPDSSLRALTARYTAPTGCRSRAIRSWMLRISGRRVRIAVTASTAALVADIVVRYGTPYAIAARRMA